MPAFKLTVAYDGAGFVGWQRQASGTSIQGLLERALAELDQGEVVVHGAGRTDAGVHALGQVASTVIRRDIDGPSLVRAINVRLPEAVRLLDAVEVDPAFHARFHARLKRYRYRIWNGPIVDPFERGYAWHVLEPLDVGLMAAAAARFEGRHDFAGFQAAGKTTVRTTERVIISSAVAAVAAGDAAAGDDAAGPRLGAVSRLRGRMLTYEVAGSGFLRHMVRTIAGTLVDVGLGRQPPEWIDALLAARNRTLAGATAPAHGLFLVGVEYD